jgi:hypothetical protein
MIAISDYPLGFYCNAISKYPADKIRSAACGSVFLIAD